MVEAGKLDLIRLADGESSLVVQVQSRHMPGVMPLHDYLDAVIVVTSGFAHGRLEVCLAPDDVDNWTEVLGALAAGRNATWMDDGRNPELRFESFGQDGIGAVVVEDVAGSGTSIRVRVRLADGWIDDHYQRLHDVQASWPREVLETSPGAYEWRR
ncbi:DUF5959 family protein [Streptomyces sp. NPDC086010]|uniref:DUF5959 family protein n=1 Tax=Streptomyces sp. NPDC086010 TaxID=3365745 RepID=UPI0037D70F32